MSMSVTSASARIAENKRIVLAYFDAMRSADLATAHRQYLHPDVRWTSVDGELDLAGMIHMGTEIQKHLKATFHIVAGTLTGEDDRVAAEAESDMYLDNGARYHNRYHFLFRLEGDKIISVHEHYDSAHANEIWKPYAAALMAKADSWIGEGE